MQNEMLGVYFYPRVILLKGFDLLQERPKEQGLDAHTLRISQPATCYRGEDGPYFCCGCYLENTASSPRASSRPSCRYAAAGRPSAGSRAGAGRPRRSVNLLCRLALRCPRVVALWLPFLLCPGLRVAAAPSPGPLQPLPRPIPARPLPSDPALHNARAQSPRVWNPAFLPLGGDGRLPCGEPRRRARSRHSLPTRAPRVPRELQPQAPRAARPCRRARPPLLSQAAAAAAMAEVHRRQHARVKGEAPAKSSTHRHEEELGMASAETLTVFLKLLAAGFYGVSSFLIVVVNKSVLTNYR